MSARLDYVFSISEKELEKVKRLLCNTAGKAPLRNTGQQAANLPVLRLGPRF